LCCPDAVDPDSVPRQVLKSPYLVASLLVGLLYSLTVLTYRRFHDHRFALVFFVLSILIIVIGMQSTVDTFFSLALRLRYGLWFALQYLAVLFTVLFTEILVLHAPKNVRRHLLLVGSSVAVGVLIWYRWEQTRPLLPPQSTHIVIDDDAPPSAQKMTFTTSESPDAVLAFYRSMLDAHGWHFTCSTRTVGCQSNITVGSDPLHDVYHRMTDPEKHGPTFEVLIRPTIMTTTSQVEVYDLAPRYLVH